MNKIFFSGVALLLVLSTILSQNNVHAASNKLHVHIIPHSHCDPGWLKTFTEYYNDHVRNILNGVVDNLQRDPKKTFNWAEISFFQLWWNEQSLEKKEELTKLVEEGRFEFIGGGVVQNDEADSSVDVVINQVTDGHDFLLRHFNTRPRIAWQVDPFGHSALTPTLFSLVGYEAMVINRIHHQLKSNYKRSKNMEFIWRASPSYGESTEMFTHVLHTHYSAPMGYDWEEGSPGIEEYNIANRATDLANAMKSRSEAYQTDQLLVPWGDDFKFQNAGWQYSNMDKLIKYISEHPELGVEISYSTLSRYFDAVHESATKNQVKFPVCDGDFFPYADNEDSYWTGYYTSRPLLKNQHRETLSVLRSTEILYALTRVETKSIDSSSVISWDSTYEQIQKARWDADLVSHHDGVTGTSRSRVVQDYLNRLASGVSDCQSISATTASLLLAKDPSNRPQLSGSSTDTVYELDEGQSYAIVYQNPVAWKRTSIVTVRVNTQAVRVLDSEGSHVISQVLPIYGRDTVGKPNDDSAVDEYEIAFTVDVAPLGLRTYFLQKSTDKEYMAVKSTVTIYANNPVPGIREMKQFTSSMNIANDNLQINFGMEGFPEKLIHKTDNTESDFRINYLEYMTSRSGAYIFRSEGRQPTSLSSSNNRLYVSKGPLVNQAVVFADKNDLRIRLYNESELTDAWIDLSHRVVPSGNNRELIVRYSTSLETDTSFFTDDGIEMRARTASHRASSRSETDYFPVQSAAFIQDENQEFVVLTKQVMGATSDKSGSLELMLHRALGQDDGRGLSEAMQDFTPYTTPHWLLFGNIPATERLRQRYSIFLEHPLRTFSGEVEDIQEWTSNYHTIYETISHDFPYNIHLRTFQVRDSFSDELVVRLSHLYEDGIHAILSKETEVPLTSLFSRYKFSNVRRVSLSTTRDLPPDQLVPTKKKYQSNGERLPLLTETDPGVREYGSKQNSEEEGVFLSKIALDLEDQKEEQPQENRRRRLLQVDTSGVSFDVVLYPIETHTFLTELTPAIELGDYVSAKYSNVTLPKHSWAKRAVGGVFNDQTRRRNQNLAEHALQQNYVGNYEIKTMLLFTVLGVGLMLGVFLRLQRRNVKKPSPV